MLLGMGVAQDGVEGGTPMQKGDKRFGGVGDYNPGKHGHGASSY